MILGYRLKEEVFLNTLKEFKEIGYEQSVTFAEYARCIYGIAFVDEFYKKHNIDSKEDILTNEKAKYITDRYFNWYFAKLDLK
jgi:hypothetical protein